MAALAAIAFCLLPARAVTDKEMEEARTITAKWYLRYANNGSGYLDEFNPKTMQELTSKLKEKEKENLKAFNSVSVPKDYASWDKAKLTEFWAVTFFTSPALSAEGKVAKSRVRQKISAMEIAAPAAQAEQPSTPEATPEPAPAPEAQAAAEAMPTAESVEAEQQDILADQKAIEKDAEDSGRIRPEGSSNTWIYVVVLIILIGVVIWLVVIAANMMKRSPDSDGNPTAEENDALREKARNTIAKKNEELARLQERVDISENKLAAKAQELERLRGDNARLIDNIADLRDENARLASSLESARESLRQLQASAEARASEYARQAGSRAPQPQEAPRTEAVRTARTATGSAPRTDSGRGGVLREIYLGRANARGLFVRADRRLSPGNSIFRLDTEDGVVGTFRLVDDTATIDMALDQPNHYLMGGCSGDNLDDTSDVTAVETVSPGTAILENGCWRVLRKSQIRYIRD